MEARRKIAVVPQTRNLDRDLSVASLQALACFYREGASPRGFYIGRESVRELPAAVGRQWVFVDDGETWVGVAALASAALVSASAATYHVATLRMRKISLRRLLKR